MRTTRRPAFLPLAALLVLLPSVASANCYSIYDGRNQLVLQSTVPPVDLSTRISETMRSRFPGSHMIMVPDDTDCREYRTGPTLSPRFDGGAAPGSAPGPDQVLQAPLLRNTASGEAPSAERSGNVLKLRRP
jgi:hypothetical protein